MKNLWKRISALSLLVLFAISALVFAACDPEPEEPTTLIYSVQVVDENDDPVSGVRVKFGNFFETTGTDGKASIELEKGEYVITLDNLPEGYTYSAQITLDTDLHEVIARLVKGEGEPDPIVPIDPDAERTYTVTVLYPNGDPVTGVTIQLCTDTACLEPYPVNAQGKATQTRKPNNYHVKINNVPEGYTYPQDSEGYYTTEELTATKTSITITLVSTAAPENTLLTVKNFSQTTDTFEVTVNGTEVYAELEFAPNRNGVYEIASDTNEYDAKIGYYAYRYSTASWDDLGDSDKNDNVSATDKNFKYAVKIYNDEILGGDGTQTSAVWVFRIFVNAKKQDGSNATFPAKFNITITRTDDCFRREITSQDAPVTATLSQFDEFEGKLSPVAMDGSAELVFNEQDGFYHLNTADRPVVTVKLTTLPRYYDRALIDFDKTIENVSGSSAVYRFDITPEEDKYNEEVPYTYLDFRMMLRGSLTPVTGEAPGGYAKYVNSDGVYGLTEDLKDFLTRFASTYDAKDYIGKLAPSVDVEDYWLFACYYYEESAEED